MTRVLLLLDFDGVIAHIKDSWLFSFQQNYSRLVTTFTEETFDLADFSPIGLCNLRSLLETPGCDFKVAWITSHRVTVSEDHPLGLAKGTETLLRECIPNLQDIFLGCTPRLSARHLEVKEFLSSLDISQFDKIVLIDDEEEQYDYPSEIKVFNPLPLVGLTSELLGEIRNYLK